MAKIKLSELTISDLIDYEKAARLICMKYERTAASFGQDVTREPNSNSQATFMKYRRLHESILAEIENRLSTI